MNPEEIGILIVDDEASVRDSLRQWFKAEGYRVDTAENGNAALKKFEDSNWDIVLLDIRMPGMDGIELQRRIKEIDRNIVAIVITAYASVDTAVKALKEGAFDYITKPIDPDDLGRLVRNAAEKRRLVQENIRLRRQVEEKLKGELRETKEALIQAEKLATMGRLTSQIAHELNNPLYGIMNTLELLKTEVRPESKRRNLLELSLAETVRLTEMLRNMLSFSKPQEEKRVPVKINELVEGILVVMEKQMREANVRVTTAFGSDVPEIAASANQIRQVVLNILKNAKESMPSGGDIFVKTIPSGGDVMIIVRDTGMGIPEEMKERIFDAFFTTKKEVKGAGLGLSVCYGIVKGHGGEIKVESEVGKGTTFIINLPVKTGETGLAESQRAAPS